MDEKFFWAIIVAAITLIIFFGMQRGWQARKRRTEFEPYPIPNRLKEPSDVLDCAYVASTKADEPLERINSAGLGFRGLAELAIYDDGLILSLRGEADFFIPRSNIIKADRATWTIDRVVEPGGLIRLRWLWHSQEVDSFFRVPDPKSQENLLAKLSETELGVL